MTEILGKVSRGNRDKDSNLMVGMHHSNPLLDQDILYEVEMPDGTYMDYNG